MACNIPYAKERKCQRKRPKPSYTLLLIWLDIFEIRKRMIKSILFQSNSWRLLNLIIYMVWFTLLFSSCHPRFDRSNSNKRCPILHIFPLILKCMLAARSSSKKKKRHKVIGDSSLSTTTTTMQCKLLPQANLPKSSFFFARICSARALERKEEGCLWT